MDRSEVLSVWWMPKDEEELWETMRMATPHRLTFLTGIFIILNSSCFSLVRLFFDRRRFTERDHVWIPHRLVECFYAGFVFLDSLGLFFGGDEDSTFLKDRVFMASPAQDLLSNIQSAYSLYSIGVALLNFRAFGREKTWNCLTKGFLILGMNYLNLLYPCVLGARLRVYWGLLEMTTVLSAIVDFLRLQSLSRKLMLFTMASMLATLVRFWVTSGTLLWGYGWLSSENVWTGVPSDVPVSQMTNTYITGMSIGAISWSYLTFCDFWTIVAMTKEWTNTHRRSNWTPHRHQSRGRSDG